MRKIHVSKANSVLMFVICTISIFLNKLQCFRDIRNLTVGSPKQKKAMHILDVTEL